MTIIKIDAAEIIYMENSGDQMFLHLVEKLNDDGTVHIELYATIADDAQVHHALASSFGKVVRTQRLIDIMQAARDASEADAESDFGMVDMTQAI
jgi:hypothetical protein